MRMPAVISALALVVFAIGGDFALAQDTAPQGTAAPSAQPQGTAAPSAQPSTSTDVEKWTKDQWKAARKQWAKDKAKWADCRQQAKTQNLKGRKSWPFLYSCMTTKS